MKTIFKISLFAFCFITIGLTSCSDKSVSPGVSGVSNMVHSSARQAADYSIEFKPAVQQAVFNGATYTSWPAFYAAFVAAYNADPQGDFYCAGNVNNTCIFQIGSQQMRRSYPKYDYYLYRYDPSNGQTYGIFFPTTNIKLCIDQLNSNYNNGAPINQAAVSNFQIGTLDLFCYVC